MKRVTPILLLVLFVLAGTPSAGAVELVNPDGSRAEPYSTWAEQSKMPKPSGRIMVHRDVSQCGYRFTPSGCAHPDGWIALATGEQPMTPQFAFLHELGHHFIFQSPRWKSAWFAAVFPGPSSVERFANAYAECAVAPYRPTWQSAYRSARFYRRLCRVIMA